MQAQEDLPQMRARTLTLTALLPAVAVILTAGLAAAPPAAAVPAASDPGAGQLLVQYKTDTTVETKTSLERAQGRQPTGARR